MKFSCSQKELLKAVLIAVKATGKSGNLPILENIFLKCFGQNLEISATNLEISILTKILAEIKNEGEVTIPAKIFSSWLNLISDEVIDFEKKEGETIFLKTQNSKTNLKGFPSDDFPKIPNVPRENECEILIKDFKSALQKTLFATSNSETRPILSGVLLISDENKLVLVSTDSYRLSEIKIPFSISPKKEIYSIIPNKTLLEVDRILNGKHEDEKIKIIFSENQVLFQIGNTQLISRLIEGKFPDYKKIIPTNFKNEIYINRKDFLQNIKRVSLFAQENSNSIQLSCKENELEIFTSETEIGNEKVVMKLKEKVSENIISINSQFLLDAILVFSSEEIYLKFGEKLNPILISSKQDSDFQHIIMPLKT